MRLSEGTPAVQFSGAPPEPWAGELDLGGPIGGGRRRASTEGAGGVL